jgi:predicted small metal-binding protein
MTMRVVECNMCGETLAAATDEELLRRLRAHYEEEHATDEFDEESAREMIAAEAYEASDS